MKLRDDALLQKAADIYMEQREIIWNEKPGDFYPIHPRKWVTNWLSHRFDELLGQEWRDFVTRGETP